MNDSELIRKYGDLLRAGADDEIIDMDDSLGIEFDFQIHKIDDLVKEFGGQMHPSRISHNVMAVITAGSGIKKIGMHRFDIGECLLMIIPAWCIHSSTDWSLDTKGYMLTFGNGFFLRLKQSADAWAVRDLFAISRQPWVRVASRECRDIAALFSRIYEENKRQDGFTSSIIGAEVLDVLLHFQRHFKAEEPVEKGTGYRLYEKFAVLIEKNITKEHSARFYAAELNTHESNLNRIIKSRTGLSAKKFISDRLVLEAKYYLAATDFPVKQIASILGFSDTNSFSRFFSRSAGEPCAAYREKLD